MGHYVRNEDARVPAAGRFNYGQKQLFWVMVLAAARAAACRASCCGFVDAMPVAAACAA